MQLQAIPFLGLAVLLAATPAGAAKCPRGTMTGQVTHVRDGDTIVVGSMPIRLNGLAAPEGNEPGGEEFARGDDADNLVHAAVAQRHAAVQRSLDDLVVFLH